MPFGDQAARAWAGKLGRLRDVVRQSIVAAQLAELFPDALSRPGRVVDIGCGQGTQALALARAGHQVVGLDPSMELLDQFRAALALEPAGVRDRVHLVQERGEHSAAVVAGPFDLICCHGVLMYLADPAPMLRALTDLAGPGSQLSLLVRNGLALAMRPGLLGHGQEALHAFTDTGYTNRLGIEAVAHTPHELDGLLEPLGWQPRAWFGIRVFTDHRDDPVDAFDRRELDALLAAEQRAATIDPYRQVAALLHLVYRRSS